MEESLPFIPSGHAFSTDSMGHSATLTKALHNFLAVTPKLFPWGAQPSSHVLKQPLIAVLLGFEAVTYRFFSASIYAFVVAPVSNFTLILSNLCSPLRLYIVLYSNSLFWSGFFLYKTDK